MNIYRACKEKNRWVVYDIMAKVFYYPPKGANGKIWALQKSKELNEGR